MPGGSGSPQLPTEIEQIEDAVITAIKAALDFRIVETWPDNADLNDLLRNTGALPACYVIYAGTRYADKKVIGGFSGDKEQIFRLTVILQDLRPGRKGGQRGAYHYIEALVGNSASAGIIKQVALAPIPGFLWPMDDSLLAVESGKFAYGIEFARKSIR